MTKEEIQYEAQRIIQEWGSNDSAPYVEFVEKLASMELPELQSNLDEAAEKEAEVYWKAQGGGSHAQWDKFIAVVKHFTEWQNEQMIKAAVDGYVYCSSDPVSESGHAHAISVLYEEKKDTPYIIAGDKVKLKIIKEDEKI